MPSFWKQKSLGRCLWNLLCTTLTHSPLVFLSLRTLSTTIDLESFVRHLTIIRHHVLNSTYVCFPTKTATFGSILSDFSMYAFTTSALCLINDKISSQIFSLNLFISFLEYHTVSNISLVFVEWENHHGPWSTRPRLIYHWFSVEWENHHGHVRECYLFVVNFVGMDIWRQHCRLTVDLWWIVLIADDRMK